MELEGSEFKPGTRELLCPQCVGQMWTLLPHNVTEVAIEPIQNGIGQILGGKEAAEATERGSWGYGL